jgi:hypothetical protein
MLMAAGAIHYNEPYLLPDTSLKAATGVVSQTGTENTPPRFKVYPNPAGSYIAIEYNLKQEGCNGQILFRDNLGKTLKEFPVSSNRYSLIIPTSGLSNGLYYVSLRCNNSYIATGKVMVQ